jgi:hypothetical protein
MVVDAADDRRAEVEEIFQDGEVVQAVEINGVGVEILNDIGNGRGCQGLLLGEGIVPSDFAAAGAGSVKESDLVAAGFYGIGFQ